MAFSGNRVSFLDVFNFEMYLVFIVFLLSTATLASTSGLHH